jgi:hypothetical protein
MAVGCRQLVVFERWEVRRAQGVQLVNPLKSCFLTTALEFVVAALISVYFQMMADLRVCEFDSEVRSQLV